MIILIVLVLAASAYFYTRGEKNKQTQKEKEIPTSDVTVVMPDIKFPETNPIEKINPFKDVYKNPFK